MELNNGLATRGSKIKLDKAIGQQILDQYASDEDVVFSCEASGLGINYQWQVKDKEDKWDNIPGAIFSKLRMSSISVDDDGKVFRCHVYNSAGSTYSEEATLTVNKPDSAPVIDTQPTSITLDAKKFQVDDAVAKIVVGTSMKASTYK